MIDPIIWKLATHAINWVVILLMLVIAGTFGHLLLSLLHKEPAISSYSKLPAGQQAQTTSDDV